MALNPPISMTGIPLRLDGEYLMLERKHIEAEFKIPVFGKRTGKGKLYITTARMVFVNGDFSKNEFKSFDIPLLSLSNEKFEQPIFGSNYLSGTVKPIYGLLPGDATFKLWFTSGGCQTFLNCFCRVMDQVRKGGQKGPDNRFIEQVRLGQFAGQKGFVDPNDPSVIYVSQPTETYSNVFGNSNPAPNSNYYGQNYGNGDFKGQGTYLGSNQPDVQNQIMQNQQPPQYVQPPPQQLNQPPPNYNQPPPNYNQPPSNFNQPPPNFNQPPPQNFNQSPPYNKPPQSYNQPPSYDFNQPPPQSYQQPPSYNQQLPPQYNQQPPAQQMYQQPPPSFNNQPPSYQNNQQFNPPSAFLDQNQNLPPNQVPNQQYQNNQPANQQPQGPQAQAQPQPQMNVAYYYGFPIGPQLKKNF